MEESCIHYHLKYDIEFLSNPTINSTSHKIIQY